MKFYVDPRTNQPSPIFYDNDDITICVGEISFEWGKYLFHHNSVSARLKPAALTELKAFGLEQCTVMGITKRMLK